MRLLLIALLSSACGQPLAETRAVTDGRLTLKMQQFQGTDSYRLVACRNDTCQNVLLTYDNKDVVFRNSDQPADNEVSLRRLVQAKTVTEKSGGSLLSDTVSIATAFVIGAGACYIIHRAFFRTMVKKTLREEDWSRLTTMFGNRIRILVQMTKDGRHYKVDEFTDELGKPWILKNINSRGQAKLIDSQGNIKKVAVRKWPGPMEFLDAGYLIAGGTIGAHLLYLRKSDRSAMFADRMTADNWQAIFSRDPTVNVKIKKDIKYIVYSLAQTFDLKINTAALQ